MTLNEIPLTDVSAPADATPSAGGCGCGGCGCAAGEAAADAPAGADALQPGDLDARAIDRSERHARILEAVAALEPGEAFVLAVDHDPQRLRLQLEATEPGQVGWTYLAQGPDLWRVELRRAPGHCC